MKEINSWSSSHICHVSMECICYGIFAEIILRIQLFLLKLLPKSLCNIQIWGTWGREENVHTSFLPIKYPFDEVFHFMYSYITYQYNKGCRGCIKSELHKKVQNKISVDVFLRNLLVIFTFSVYKLKIIEFIIPFQKGINILIRKPLIIMSMPFILDVSFISIINLYFNAFAALLQRMPKKTFENNVETVVR